MEQDLTGFEIYDGLTLRPKKNFKLSIWIKDFKCLFNPS